jgi:hypothetical protein
MTDDFAAEITNLARSLTPGGVLLVLGAKGGYYPAIYERLERLLDRPGIDRIAAPSELRAHSDSSLASIVEDGLRNQMAVLADAAPSAFREVGDQLPMSLTRPNEPFTWPRFRMLAWRNARRQ